MIKKITQFLFSTKLMSALFIFFAAAMAVGTFMDASSETSPTPYSREMIYNAWWFELIMVLLMINFIGNIKKYRLFRKKQWASLMLHLSFILILLGAFVTRYISYEGVMHIREGATQDTFLSSDAYLSTFIDGDYMVDSIPQRRRIAPKLLRLSERLNNDFSIETDYNGQPVTIEFKDYIENAKKDIVLDDEGTNFIKIVESGGMGNRHEHWIADGQLLNIHDMFFTFNNPMQGAVNITHDNGNYTIVSPTEGQYMRMADQLKGTLVADSVQPFLLRSLYQIHTMSFVVPEGVVKGSYQVIKAPADQPTNQNALIVDVTSNNETRTVDVLGGKGFSSKPIMTEVGGLKVYLRYGSIEYKLPFSITLNDFIADKYPGTQKSYSAFMSKVTVNQADSTFYDYDIYMNNILDQGGYRFFQASFDNDEKGTILSVNHDFWGTWITYIGYFFLYFGLLAILFDNNSRFGFLRKRLKKIRIDKGSAITLFVLFFSVAGFAQHEELNEKIDKSQIDSILSTRMVSKDHANKFANLVIQDNGRMKPVNTFASELLRKISRKSSYGEMDANQVFMSMIETPRLWLEAPLIKLKRGNDSIRKIIGVPLETSHISLMDLFDEEGDYKLEPYLEAATSTNTPNQFQKDFVKAHESFYLLNRALSGSILKIFPIQDDENNRWVSYSELAETNYKDMDSVFANNILKMYYDSLETARTTNDYTEAEQLLGGISNFQKKFGSEVHPSDNKIKAEIAYNKADIFNRLYKYFAMFGIFMFLFIIIQIFRESKTLLTLIKVCKYIIWIFFIMMTLGLALRWYVSGHAPWSDAYESIIYVAWATVLFGLTLGRKSFLTIASTAFVAAIILWVGHQNWLDPSIANLQPVLNSYWLMIHVAVIVGSYGPFTLGMILGAASLMLMILTTKKNKKKMRLNIDELTVINEMALTVGLVMLAIGNFLGGQWANESWGRYWGWDPKETWALISIMIYAFVVHMRLVPGLQGRWTFNFAAVIAYGSIMMTYFGVNFYLTGLHSYASGDTPVTPTFVYYIIGSTVVLSALALYKYRKHYHIH